MDDMFWASKLHFHMTGVQFYNFPYTFGYLFALGVYAQQESKGESFHQAYVDLLRDTGRMTAEHVVEKHLAMSIEDPDFWRGECARGLTKLCSACLRASEPEPLPPKAPLRPVGTRQPLRVSVSQTHPVLLQAPSALSNARWISLNVRLRPLACERFTRERSGMHKNFQRSIRLGFLAAKTPAQVHGALLMACMLNSCNVHFA